MVKLVASIAAATLAAIPVPASAGAGDFVLINGTGKPLASVAIRRFGTAAWQSLAVAPGAGSQASVPFDDEDCAFDIRATLADQDIVWSGVNLCDVKAVTLHRDGSGAAWADYD